MQTILQTALPMNTYRFWLNIDPIALIAFYSNPSYIPHPEVLYDMGTLKASSLDDAFEKLNHTDIRGRSCSVGDVLESTTGRYLCLPQGWKHIESC